MFLSHSEDNESSLCSGNSNGDQTRKTNDSHKTHPCGALCKKSGFKGGPNEGYLPQVDGGVHAWLFLLAATMLEALVWGKLFQTRIKRRGMSRTNLIKVQSRIRLFIWGFPGLL